MHAVGEVAGGGDEVSRLGRAADAVLPGIVAWTLLLVAWLVWTPLDVSAEPNWPRLWPRIEPIEVGANVALFAPFGAAVALLHRRPSLAGIASIATLASCLVELGQIPMLGRMASVTDVLANAIGAVIGAAVARAMAQRFGRARVVVAGSAALLVAVAAWTMLAGLYTRSALRLTGWDPDYEITAGHAAGRPDKPFLGALADVSLCGGTGAAAACASPGADRARRRALVREVERSQRLTMRARIHADADQQFGPERTLLDFAADESRRNLTLVLDDRSLVLRFRTRLTGHEANAYRFVLPDVVRPGEPLALAIHVSEEGVRTELASATGSRVISHRLDAAASGIMLLGGGEVTPREVASTRAVALATLILPVLLAMRAVVVAGAVRP